MPSPTLTSRILADRAVLMRRDASRLRHVFASSARWAQDAGVWRHVCLIFEGWHARATQVDQGSSGTVAVQPGYSPCFDPYDGIVWQVGCLCWRKQCAAVADGWLASTNRCLLVELQASISHSRARVNQFTQRFNKGVKGYEEQSSLDQGRRGSLVENDDKIADLDQCRAVRREGWRGGPAAGSLSSDWQRRLRPHKLDHSHSTVVTGLGVEPDARTRAADFGSLGPPGPRRTRLQPGFARSSFRTVSPP